MSKPRIINDDVYGNVSGDVRGNVSYNVRGNVGSDVCGYVAGSVRGNVGGDVCGDVKGSVRGNVVGDVSGDVSGTIGGQKWKEEFFLGGMEGYEAGFADGFNEGICYALSILYEKSAKQISLAKPPIF